VSPTVTLDQTVALAIQLETSAGEVALAEAGVAGAALATKSAIGTSEIGTNRRRRITGGILVRGVRPRALARRYRGARPTDKTDLGSRSAATFETGGGGRVALRG
jgi:hypothetical protein